MNESVAVAKETDAKNWFSSTRSSEGGTHRAQNEPERQLGSLGVVIGNIRSNGGTPSADSIATQLSSMHTAQRAPVLSALQQTHGNRYVQRVVSGIQAKVEIGQPEDKYEQEADRVADVVMPMHEPRVQRQVEGGEEEEKKEEEELVQTKLISDEFTPPIQRQEETGEEKEEGEEELVQTKPITEQTSPLIQRQAEEEEEEEKEEVVQPKSEKSTISYDPIRYVQRAVAWIQAKLKIGPPNDRYEQEADRVADVVMRMPEPQVQRQPVEGGKEEEKKEEEEVVQTKTIAEQITPVVQRQEETEEEENPVQAKSLIQCQYEGEEVQTKSSVQLNVDEEEKEQVQAKPAINPERRVPASIENAVLTNNAGGVPLYEQTQAEMGRRFGADFSAVRVHTDADAVQMNRAIGAQAFTHGSHIYFGAGKYNPHNGSGGHLLAHELTHVVQQGGAVSKKPASISRSLQSIQRLPGVIASGLNQYARHIPGYTLFTVIIGYNPLTGRNVAQTTQNLLGGLMGLVPFGTALYDKLIELGIVRRAFTVVRNELQRFDLSLTRLERTIKNAWDDIRIVRGLSYNIGVLRLHFGTLLADVRGFASSIANRVLVMIKESLLGVLRQVAERISGYSLFTKILGRDPLTGETIERNTVQIIEEFLILIGRREHLEKMRETGTIQRIADWIDTQLALLNFSFAEIRALVTEAWNAFSFHDVINPVGAFNRTVNTFRPLVSRIFTFAYNVASTVLRFIKDALLGALSRFARRVPGFTLLTVILGRDPFSNIPVACNATNLILGFMEFVPGGREKFKNLQESGAIDQAFGWLGNEIEILNLSWESIRELFYTAWNSLSIHDLIDPIGAFKRMVALFRAPVQRIIRFASAVGMKILEFIFEGVMGAGGTRVLNILKRAKGTFLMIVKDPIAFVSHLIDAVVQGFKQFASNILKHLRAGLVGWLFGSLEGAGLQLPEKFDLKGIISLVLQILGLTYQRIRPKLVRLLGERTVSILERTFEFLRQLVTEGPAAAWRRIVEYAGNLRDKVMEGIRNFVIIKIVTAAITRLATMWNPAGAVVQAIIGIYNTIMFFIERINQIMALVESITNSVSSIAAGNIKAASNFVEQTMGRTLPVIISFFARLLGLGNISGAIRNIIRKIRRPIDKAIDRMVDWIAKQAKRLARRGRAAVGGLVQWWRARKQFSTGSGQSHTLFFEGQGTTARLMIRSKKNTYAQYINQILINETDPRKTQKETALKKAKEVAKQIDGFKGRTKPSESGTRDQTQDFTNLFNQLANHTSIFTEEATGEQPTSTPPKYGSLNSDSGFGTEMYIRLLSNIHPPGSRPTVTNQKWVDLLKRRQGGRSYYCLGHLLSNRLGGPGTTWQNLAPLRQNDNQTHEKIVESKIKKAVNKGRLFTYTVVAKYGSSVVPTGPVTESDIASNQNVEEVRRVREAERFIPRGFTCTATEIDRTQKPKKGGLEIHEITILNQIDSDLRNYDVTGEGRRRVTRLAINNPGDTRERAIEAYQQMLPGVGTTRAGRLYGGRKYQTFEQIVDKNDGISMRMVERWAKNDNITLDGETR